MSSPSSHVVWSEMLCADPLFELDKLPFGLGDRKKVEVRFNLKSEFQCSSHVCRI